MYFFFFNDTATTEIYTLSLHDALPICSRVEVRVSPFSYFADCRVRQENLARTSSVGWGPFGSWAEMASRAVSVAASRADRKSTRLNSSHANISYAVFCLKKKNIPNIMQ